jgi:hypothetical protein
LSAAGDSDNGGCVSVCGGIQWLLITLLHDGSGRSQ